MLFSHKAPTQQNYKSSHILYIYYSPSLFSDFSLSRDHIITIIFFSLFLTGRTLLRVLDTAAAFLPPDPSRPPPVAPPSGGVMVRLR